MSDTPTPEIAPLPEPTEAPAPAPEQKKVVHIGRATIALNVLLQLLIFAALILMVNYLSFRHFKRWDFSRDQKYALSSQTKAVLGSLPKTVKAVIFFSGASEIYPDVQALLREYEYASNKRFNTEIVDPYRNITRAQELQTKYKFGANENILILDYDGKSKFVNANDMAEIDTPDQMAMMMGQGPRVKAFKGEQVITSALIELVESKPNKIYYLTGHGEAELTGPDTKVFNESLKRQNIQVAALTLLNQNSVPEDARGLILNAPKRDISELEQKLISDYWDKKGRIFVNLNPTSSTPRLRALLVDNGVTPADDRVIRTGTYLSQNEDGGVALKSGLISSPTFTVLDSHTKLTKDLEGATKQFLGDTQSLQIDRTKEQTARERFTPLLESGEGFWGETEFADKSQTPFFDPAKDRLGPLTLAVAVEKGGVADTRVKVETARLVVIGNGEVLSDKAYRLSEGVTIDLAMNTLNWLLDREELIGIPAKEKKQMTIKLDELQMNRLKALVLLVIPGIVAICGIGNWWARRS